MPCKASYYKYKGQDVPVPPDFRATLQLYRDPTTGVSLGVRRNHKSRRVKCRGGQKEGSPPVAGGTARPSELPQDNHGKKCSRSYEGYNRVLTSTMCTQSLLAEKYYLMTNLEDHLHEFLTMTRLKITTIRFDGASVFGRSSCAY